MQCSHYFVQVSKIKNVVLGCEEDMTKFTEGKFLKNNYKTKQHLKKSTEYKHIFYNLRRLSKFEQKKHPLFLFKF